MPQPLPAQKRNVFEAVNHVLFPVYFYVRLVLNFVGIVLLLLLHSGTVFAHDRWRLVAGLVFGFVSAAIVVLSAFLVRPLHTSATRTRCWCGLCRWSSWPRA